MDGIFKANDGGALRFYYEAVRNNFMSERMGRPVFDNVLFVEVITPGSATSTPIFEIERTASLEATPDGQERAIGRTSYYQRFREQVEAFKVNNGEGGMDGTPLHQWPQLDAGTAATFRALGIITVEMLAAVTDGNLSNLGTGGLTLREQARGFIQSREFGVPSAQMSASMAHLQEDVARLTRENTELRELLAAKPGQAKPQMPLRDPLDPALSITGQPAFAAPLI